MSQLVLRGERGHLDSPQRLTLDRVFSTFVVTEKATRSAGSDTKCFYCRGHVGGYHRNDCVLLRRKAMVRLWTESAEFPVTLEYVEEATAHCDASDIEFRLNESSWCANNVMNDLVVSHPAEAAVLQAFLDSTGDCLCTIANFEYLHDLEGDAGAPYCKE